MIDDLGSFLAGMAFMCAVSVGFLLFAMWHNKRYPLLPPEDETAELSPRSTTIYASPSYGLRIVK